MLKFSVLCRNGKTRIVRCHRWPRPPRPSVLSACEPIDASDCAKCASTRVGDMHEDVVDVFCRARPFFERLDSKKVALADLKISRPSVAPVRAAQFHSPSIQSGVSAVPRGGEEEEEEEEHSYCALSVRHPSSVIVAVGPERPSQLPVFPVYVPPPPSRSPSTHSSWSLGKRSSQCAFPTSATSSSATARYPP